jgi:DNA polymerase (family X)
VCSGTRTSTASSVRLATNAEVASALHEIADLLEIKGETRFRITAYRRGAEAVEGSSRDVCDLNESELQSISGIGKGVAARVKEFCATGKMKSLEDLRAQVPIGLREMTRVPGLGPKRAMDLYRAIGVSNLDELKEAAEANRISEVKGFGTKVEQRILEAIERGVTVEERTLLAQAYPMASELVEVLRGHPAIEQVAFAGSLRRYRETIGDIDILAATSAPEEVIGFFNKLHGIAKLKVEGTTKVSVETTRGMQMDLRVIEPDAWGAALQYFTGSQAHNVKVRERAVRMGFKLSEYGLFRVSDDVRIASRTEEEVYEALGMRWVPPTMREDKGEVEAAVAGELPEAVQLEEMRGDLQSHTTYSDGKVSVLEMALAAAAKGYAYYATTDHGPRLTYMKNLGIDEIAAQRAEVVAANEQLGDRLRVLHGVELNIAADGSLDYPDDILSSFDICVASIHSSFRLSKSEQTKRLLRAIENPHVHVIGHPSGRRLDRREGIDFDVTAVARAAVKHKVALEVNAHPWRLDLRDDHVRWAREEGANFVISTDAHSVAELDNMHFGVATAQRGWAQADMVINTWPLERLLAFLTKR